MAPREKHTIKNYIIVAQITFPSGGKRWKSGRDCGEGGGGWGRGGGGGRDVQLEKK